MRCEQQETRNATRVANAFPFLFDATAIGIAFVDLRRFRFFYANPMFCDIVGHAPDELASMAPWELMQADQPDPEKEVFAQLAQGEPLKRVLEKSYLRKDGAPVWLRFTTSLAEVEGMPVGLTLVEDVSGEKFARIRLANSESRLKKRNDAKDVLLASLAHELRNPLAAISNSVELMNHMRLEHPQMQVVIGILQRQTQQLSRLVDEMLDTSRVAAGKVALDAQNVLINEVLERAVDGVEPAIRRRSQRLNLDIVGDQLFVSADLARLTQVFANLLDNASKYSPDGAHIGLVVRRRGEEVRVVVEDSGDGIPEEQLPHVFDLFAQGTKLGQQSRGLGIGLTIVKRLVELHRGRISVASVVGKGTTVEVVLPLAGCAHVACNEDPYADTSPEPTRPMRIMVVDDNTDAASSLSLCLEMYGHVVRTASNGADALALARRFRPDVSLVDIEMPDMSGCEVAARLRAAAETAGTVLVALTGHADIACCRRDFTHHLVKPVTTAQLDSLLRQVTAS